MLEMKWVPRWVSVTPPSVRVLTHVTARPVSLRLFGACGPPLSGVGVEQDAEPPRAEPVADPGPEGPRVLHRVERGSRVAGEAARRLERAQVPQGVAGLDRVGEETAAV